MKRKFRYLYRRLFVFITFTLGLTRREKIGIIIIYPLGLALLLLATWYEAKPLSEDQANLLEYSLHLLQEEGQKDPVKSRIVLEPFNPDTVSAKQLAAYGLSGAVINAWVNYREKAGGFSYSGQIKNLYPMTDSVFDVIRPFIKFPERTVKKLAVQHQPVVRQMEKLDINLADSLLWRSLRGIGPVLSGRIIKYRNLLGGFVSPVQLQEVYGIDSTLFTQIAPLLYVSHPAVFRKIDLSSDSYAQLRAHPYLSSRQASAIVHYRSQHGRILSVDVLFDIELIDSLTINRLKPYVLEKDSINE